MAGRRPKTSQQRKASGNAGKRGIIETPQAEPLKEVSPPAEVAENAEALAIWNAILPELVRLKLVTRLSVELYGAACTHLADAKRFRRLSNVLLNRVTEKNLLVQTRDGKGNQKTIPNPDLTLAISLAGDALSHFKEARACCIEGGLTPGSIRKLAAGAPGKPADPRKQKWGRELDGGGEADDES